MRYPRPSKATSLVALGLFALAAAMRVPAADDTPPTTFRAPKLEPAAEARVLALNCERLSADDVRALSAAPAPRVMLLHGGVFPVYLLMVSFGRFLVGMGYPEASIRDPASGDWSYSPYMDTRQLAGLIAWQYERDGMRPMMVGHSQGGLYVVKILKDLAGRSGDTLQVWNPHAWDYESRTSITDPFTGKARPVVGLSVAYGSAVGAGGWALLLPNQWENLDTLRKIPDTVDEFTGFFVAADLIALSFPGNPLDSPYTANSKAVVRNVTLPATYNHITVPVTDDLPQDPAARAWIEAYFPGSDADTSTLSLSAQLHVLYAADVWYSVKKHWCLESQNLIRQTAKPEPAPLPKPEPVPPSKPEAATPPSSAPATPPQSDSLPSEPPAAPPASTPDPKPAG
jgi:hypothetical protein